MELPGMLIIQNCQKCQFIIYYHEWQFYKITRNVNYTKWTGMSVNYILPGMSIYKLSRNVNYMELPGMSVVYYQECQFELMYKINRNVSYTDWPGMSVNHNLNVTGLSLACGWLVSDQNPMRLEQVWNLCDTIRRLAVTPRSAVSDCMWSYIT